MNILKLPENCRECEYSQVGAWSGIRRCTILKKDCTSIKRLTNCPLPFIKQSETELTMLHEYHELLLTELRRVDENISLKYNEKDNEIERLKTESSDLEGAS